MESHNTLGLDDIERLQKRGIRLAESYGAGTVFNEDNPLQGITKKQRNRNKKAGDVPLTSGPAHVAKTAACSTSCG